MLFYLTFMKALLESQHNLQLVYGNILTHLPALPGLVVLWWNLYKTWGLDHFDMLCIFAQNVLPLNPEEIIGCFFLLFGAAW